LWIAKSHYNPWRILAFFLAFDEWHALAKRAHRPKILLLLANSPDAIAQVRAFGRCRTAMEE
jgi:hypothetical protein